jgi:CubicO group peptidase (beta-lactamase class C family)
MTFRAAFLAERVKSRKSPIALQSFGRRVFFEAIIVPPRGLPSPVLCCRWRDSTISSSEEKQRRAGAGTRGHAMKPLLPASAILGLCQFAAAAELPRTDPASVGLDVRQLDAITVLLKKDVADHVLPGAVLLIARHGKVAYEQTVGSRDPQNGESMKADNIFRIYSMSKPITVVAALTLVEAGRLQLDDPISKYLPEFASMQVGIPSAESPDGIRLVPAERPITVQDLMRHSSGLTYGIFSDTPVKKAYQQAHLGADNPDLATWWDGWPNCRSPISQAPPGSTATASTC